ncbi:alpha/beta fold hydrolase [Stakelama sp. CBK3Z-3]|uniref:Alpha/beta fold hydrolase n=1 Tax=Stakelama flava TaxID=2860338 RepID=A0ABS6XHU2_9SPHN|nr:alpha/beta fold hydrolase [Stakelama flava]MBW4329742.1 alpha/beta fold hydrolase [Stakelama flava]
MKAIRTAALCMAALATSGTAARAAAISEELHATGPEGPLAGTALIAGSKAPVVLIIPGSGPTDRDGDNPMGVKAASLKLLAQGLAANGISSVRIDKRGMFGSKGAVADPDAVTIGAYADDVESWIGVIRERTGAPCIWVAGHSEGGLVALAAGQRDAAICGLILIDAPGRPLGKIMREQLRSNAAAAPLLPDAMKVIDSLEAGQKIDVSGMHPGVAQIFHPGVQNFLIDLFAQRPAKLAHAYDGPLMIVWGSHDIQVTKPDYDALAAAAPNATTLVVPDMNHALKTVKSDDRAANIAAYGDPDLPLADGLVTAIAAFIIKDR